MNVGADVSFSDGACVGYGNRSRCLENTKNIELKDLKFLILILTFDVGEAIGVSN